MGKNYWFDYEKPNVYLYTFTGKLETDKKATIALDANNFILRGCSLKNTKWVIGCVAYTGYWIFSFFIRVYIDMTPKSC